MRKNKLQLIENQTNSLIKRNFNKTIFIQSTPLFYEVTASI